MIVTPDFDIRRDQKPPTDAIIVVVRSAKSLAWCSAIEGHSNLAFRKGIVNGCRVRRYEKPRRALPLRDVLVIYGSKSKSMLAEMW